MICYIELTRENNSTLQEKAGREGFIENKAYKQFRSIIENFSFLLLNSILLNLESLRKHLSLKKRETRKIMML